MTHFLGIEELSASDLLAMLAESAACKAALEARSVPQRHGLIVNLFFEASTRTRVSFEVAARRLGLEVINWTTTGSSQEKGETLLDTAQNVAAMGPCAIVVRHPAAGAPWLLAQRLRCPIVNAGDGAHEHPSQALLDALTLQERLGSLHGKVVAIIGDITHSRVARSNVFALSKLGVRLRLCGPSSFLPSGIESLVPGGAITVHRVLDEALCGVDAVMALRIQRERLEGVGVPGLREYQRRFGLTAQKLARLAPGAVVLHPGPVNRGVEMTSEVADGAQSAVLAQVRNGVAVRMAILNRVLGRVPGGAP